MKPIITLLPFILLSVFLNGQRIEYAIHINSGRFFYTGNEARGTTFMINSTPGNVSEARANILSGTRSGFSFDGSASIRKITKSNFIYGIDAGAESLQSKIHVMLGTDNGAAKGNAYLRNNYINYYLFAGQRFNIKKVQLDVSAGPEGAHLLSSREKDIVTYPGTDSIFTIIRKDVHPDPIFIVRLRTQLNAWHKKWGVNIGYSYDLTNIYSDGDHGPLAAHGNYIRLGLSYKIK